MRHVPVLLDEVLAGLKLRPGARVVDATLGDAGHAERILETIGRKGRLLGIDVDPESLLRAKQYLYRFGNQVIFVRDNFARLQSILTEHQFEGVNALVLDLGWSSPQFAERGRGFSFLSDEPLDMRYAGTQDTSAPTAAQIVNTFSEAELAKLFRTYGEEKRAAQIARAIREARQTKPFERTSELAEVVLQSYRELFHTDQEVPWVGGLHPATKVFQALRIAVNQELEVLKQVLPQAVAALAPGGRLAVITFHSLEDRIVKQFFGAESGKTVKLITKKPIVPSAAEVASNSRARSAKLRLAEKI